MKYLILVALISCCLIAEAQTNSFPLFSNGTYSGGSSDFTNVTTPQLKLQATSGFIRVPHLSQHSTTSVVYNFQTGKDVYWGEPSDVGSYFFRGRNLLVESGNVGVGTSTPQTKLDVLRSTDGNVASFNGPNSGLTIQPNTSSVDLVGYTAASGYRSIFLRSGANGLLVNPSGNVGIGTNSPVAKLDINGYGGQLLNYTNKIIDADNQDMISIRSATKGSVLNLVSSRTDAGPLGGLVFTTTNGWTDSHLNIAGIVGSRVSTEPYAGGYLAFWTKYGAGDIPKERMRIGQDGSVGIGTTNPDATLAVKGTVHAQEVKVDLSVPGPDYVFEENYNLPSLTEIENYINQNKHLSEVPSAKEMETKGINLSEMNMVLLKKVEELTLHLIEKEKQIVKLEKRIEQVEKQSKL